MSPRLSTPWPTDPACCGAEPSGGITGVHEWLFSETPAAVHLTTTESFAGEPVDADPAGTQTVLDASLVAWLGLLKRAADSSA